MMSQLPTHVVKLSPPPQGVIKINVDAAFKAGQGAGGIVVRDAGRNLISLSSILFEASSILMAEAHS